MFILLLTVVGFSFGIQ